MELRVSKVTLPEAIAFNYEELKKELTEKVSIYENMVYSDAQIKEAKADKAQLNKLKKALNDERIRLEKEYMKPFNDFKLKINEIIGIIDRPVAVIDAQVKNYEEKIRNEKMEAITEIFNSIGFQPFVQLPMIMDQKWLNASVSLKKIEEQMREVMYKVSSDLVTLSGLECSYEAQEIYKSTLDIHKAIAEGQRLAEIQKRKLEAEEAELERKKAEEEAAGQTADVQQRRPAEAVEEASAPHEDSSSAPAEEKQWVAFRALLTTADAVALREFFLSRNIDYRAI